MQDALSGIGFWEYIAIATLVLSVILLILWLRASKRVGRVESELSIFEDEYKKKLHEAEKLFNKQIAIEKREREREIDEKKEKFLESLRAMRDEHDRKVEAIERRHREEIEKLKRQRDKEKEELDREREKILAELEQYQSDLERMMHSEMDKIRDSYRRQMELIQDENAKLIDQMNRTSVPSIVGKTPKFAPPEPREGGEVDANNQKLHSTIAELRKLKEQLFSLEERSRQELAAANKEIANLKKKFKIIDLKA